MLEGLHLAAHLGGGRPGETPFRVCLFGGPLDTGNLGVSALGLATIAAASGRMDLQVQVFDHGEGVRARDVALPDGAVRILQRGLWFSRRVHRPESLYRLAGSSIANTHANPTLEVMRGADAIWDISGGDSFSDIYGERRFLKVSVPKLVALQHARRLVLLPQTYGPFRQPVNRRIARRIVVGADQVWTRDHDSHGRLAELAGDDFDAGRHREGVDVAFLLPRVAPDLAGSDPILGWLEEGRSMVGVNVSGLLGSPRARERFGLAADHQQAVTSLVRRFLECTDERIVLVPHVLGDGGESDLVACRRVRDDLADERVQVLSGPGLDATTTKWVVSHMQWMTGARMHATIAALSTMTPVTGIAYSDKMRGVFAACGVADHVADARALATPDLVDALWEDYGRRGAIADALARHVPGIVQTAEAMFDDLVSTSMAVVA